VRVGLSDPEAALRVLTEGGLSARMDGRLIAVDGVTDGADVTRRLAHHGLWVNELVPVRADLESVFLQLTADDTLEADARAQVEEVAR
jgi:ABC-2 type transport system ATP-binding protein